MTTPPRTPDPLPAESLPPTHVDAEATPTLSTSSLPDVSAGVKLLLVEFRSGEAVLLHPEVAPLIQQGWRLRSAVPRIVEGEGLKLLVTLGQAGKKRAKQPRKARRVRALTAKLS